MKIPTKKLVLTALFIALGLLFPQLFHLFGAGPVFLPMHIPILICGFVCGAPYGAFCGLVVPLLSSVLTGMPVFYPTALAMALELCTYGLMTGLLYLRLRWNVYPALLVSMLCGRAVSGIANAVLLGVAGKPYGWQTFLTASFVTGLPGIAIQIVLVPLLVALLVRFKVIQRADASGTAETSKQD